MQNCIKKFTCYEAKIEESEKDCRKWNPGHLWVARATSALPLSYGNQTTINPACLKKSEKASSRLELNLGHLSQG